MTTGEFCNREVIVASRDTDVLSIAKLMRQRHVGDIVIVDDSDPDRVLPIGIITDRDIVLEVIASEVALDSICAGDVMSSELITAQEQDGLWNTVQRMHAFGVRRMVVINEHGGLEGIITVDDVIELLADELTALAKTPVRGQKKEKKLRD